MNAKNPMPIVVEQYIEMCEKAAEIQDCYRSRIPAADDIFVGKITRGSVLLIQLFCIKHGQSF